MGANPTMALEHTVAALDSEMTIAGIGGGTMTLGFGSIAFDAAVRIPYSRSRGELTELLGLARAGKISVEVQNCSLDDGTRAYADLTVGTIRGRAVIVP